MCISAVVGVVTNDYRTHELGLVWRQFLQRVAQKVVIRANCIRVPDLTSPSTWILLAAVLRGFTVSQYYNDTICQSTRCFKSVAKHLLSYQLPRDNIVLK